MELTEETLAGVLAKVATDERIEPPQYMFVHWDYLHTIDRILNPWKGKRAKWLTTKRG